MTVSKKIILGVTLAAMVGSIAAGSVMAKEKEAKFGPRAMIMEMDQDKDGAIKMEELKVFLDKKFNEADANNDKMLEGKEIAYTLDGRRGKHMAKRAVHMFDMDGDKKISRSEMDDRSAKIFAFFDVNGDGTVDKSEMPNRKKFKKHRKEMKEKMKLEKKQQDQN